MYTEWPLRTFISYSINGAYAYIYIWISKSNKVIYVGQTNDKRGSFGRAYSHLYVDKTFRGYFEDEIGLSLEMADDLTLLSFPLPLTREYTSNESSYREAVEYLVQTELYAIRGDIEPAYKILSSVRYSDRAILGSIKSQANEIIKEFIDLYPSL